MSRDFAAIDELLQIMFWLRNEGLLPDVSAVDLARFVPQPADSLQRVLDDMAAAGYVRAVNGRYTLTDNGAREGARRFADEFAELTKPGHGECDDPDCDCHETGSPADCVHRAGGRQRSIES